MILSVKPYLAGIFKAVYRNDYRITQDNTINVVIPLWYIGEQASLVVFDQQWFDDSVTWCLNGPLIHFEVNTGVPGNPCDYDKVLGLTDKDIDEEFYNRYLSHRPRSSFFGLTGNAFPFQPGSIIVFDNRNIHCTSKFAGAKLGISLRFRKI